MPNDAKLGLVLGVSLVIAVAVVFFRRDLVTAQPNDNPAGAVGGAAGPPAASTTSPTAPPNAVRDQLHPVRARTAERTTESRAAGPSTRRHTVREGDTLFSLARHYYGDGDRFIDLYRANRPALKDPDALEPGTVLVIPDVLAEAAGNEDETAP
jgi:nucleoid-associated protein YgaU